MKGVRTFFFSLGVLALVAILVFGISLLFKPSGAPVEQGAGAISPAMMAHAQEMAARIGRRMAWVMILFSAVLQLGAWIAAVLKMNTVKTAAVSAEKKLQLLEAIDVYFDLPLYFGLLGSVCSFIVITFFPDAGLMFAYASTAMGIIVSVILRLGYHTPFKQELLHACDVTAN
ncbi:MAG: hypothetical protein AB7E95_02055 [Kiritimatiellales bacterium]